MGTDLLRKMIGVSPQIIGGCAVVIVLMVVLAFILAHPWPLAVASVPAAVAVLLVMWRRNVPDDEWE